MNKVKVYDIEVFRNYISFIFIDFEDYLNVRKRIDKENMPRDKAIKAIEAIPYDLFEISAVDGYEVNNTGGIMAYTTQNDYLASFNGLNYDDLILNFISMNSGRYKNTAKLIEKTYEFSKKLVETDKEILYKDESVKIIRKYNGRYKSIDVQKIAALDKIQKSLKLTLVNLKWHSILDYHMPPISDLDQHYYNPEYIDYIQNWDRYVMKEYLSDLVSYNKNDVLGTSELFYFLFNDIKLRFDISDKYKVNVLSASDSKIGDKIVSKYYIDATGISYTDFYKFRTYRKGIKLENCISQFVNFRTETFQKLKSRISNIVVNSTKEVDIPFTYDGVTYRIKSGGIHSEDTPAVFQTNEKHYIREADVSGYYPNLIINGGVCPKHLDKDAFISVVKRIIEDKNEGKRIKDKTKEHTAKISANAIFGKFNFEMGPLFDTKCTLDTTISGQLELLMLVERLSLANIPTISANTDGIVCKIPVELEDIYYKICKEWEKDVRLKLDYTDYALYVRRDVNNYFVITDINNPYETMKAKGRLDEYSYIHFPKLQKGFNYPIIPRAIVKYFVENIPVEKTIKEHKDIYDFCAMQNIARKFKLQWHYVKDGNMYVKDVQRNTRFYNSITGGALLKYDTISKKTNNLSAGQYVTVFNHYIHHENMKNYNIDYGFYIRKCNDIINQIKTGVKKKAGSKKKIQNKLDQLSLFD